LAPLSCVVSVASCWAALPLLQRVLGHEAAVFWGFGVASLLALAHWRALVPPRSSARSPSRRKGSRSLYGAAGVVMGLGGFPTVFCVVAALGLGLGLEPVPGTPPLRGSALHWVAACVFAPVFEELFYRVALFRLLRRGAGRFGAALLSTLAFAAVHPGAWGVVAGCVVGGGLSGVMWVRNRVELCIGLHAGLNLGSLLLGAPPSGLGVAVSLALVALAAGVALGLHRRASNLRWAELRAQAAARREGGALVRG